MQSLNSLVKTLQADYPHLTFARSDDFLWSPQLKTIFYTDDSSESAALLHELSHALLDHNTYEQDIELLVMETAAWEHARTVLGQRYAVAVDDNRIESHLDSYRDWLHLRSLCPTCSQTGFQTQTNRYSCMNCNGSWRVNDARRCRLRRTPVTI